MKISYCTTCRDRLWQLRQTYLENIFQNDNDSVEFVLLDYNSSDGLEAWVREFLSEFIAGGRVVFARERSALYFHAARAKNIAHRLASGDVVVNLDADNWCEGITSHLWENFRPQCVYQYYNQNSDGSFGRIALARDAFLRLGGYNESFLPMVWEDSDLLERAKLIGLDLVATTFEKRPPIPNAEHHQQLQPSWSRQQESNVAKGRADIAAGHLTANPAGWGLAELSINFQPAEWLSPVGSFAL